MTEAARKELPEAREVCPTTTRVLLGDGALLVDVREKDEAERVAFADCEVLNIPLSPFEQRWSEVPRDRDVVVASTNGEAGLKATYFLLYQGYERVSNMKHGMVRWIERGFPIIGEASVSSMSAEVGCGCGAASPKADACC
ncbi:MAG TPA: rhodanese-like domain-containing protein [Rhizobium sp.]|nr:rhodanese-like domain-containing protein [Rhizobium sp.]